MSLPSIKTLGAPQLRTHCGRCGIQLARSARRITYKADDRASLAHCVDCRPYVKGTRP